MIIVAYSKETQVGLLVWLKSFNKAEPHCPRIRACVQSGLIIVRWSRKERLR